MVLDSQLRINLVDGPDAGQIEDAMGAMNAINLSAVSHVVVAKESKDNTPDRAAKKRARPRAQAASSESDAPEPKKDKSKRKSKQSQQDESGSDASGHSRPSDNELRERAAKMQADAEEDEDPIQQIDEGEGGAQSSAGAPIRPATAGRGLGSLHTRLSKPKK